MFKRSITSSLARALFAIVLLSVLSSALALVTLSASLRDAEAINIAGSLRMQSYRLAWDASSGSSSLMQDMASYRRSLTAPVLLSLEHAWVPASVKNRYGELRLAWARLEPQLTAGYTGDYQHNISRYVSQIDEFVLALQHWAELKMKLVACACLLGFIAIAALVAWTLRQAKKQVVGPLHELVTASQQIEQANFHSAPLKTELPNELGILARAFTHMSAELEKHYQHLELAVRDKTRDLRQANRRLALLYQCSEMLRKPDNEDAYAQVLQLALEHENLNAIELNAPPQLRFHAGKPDAALAWQRFSLNTGTEMQAGELRWQSPHSDTSLMQSLATMLTRSILLEHAEQSVRHLLLMEERATIARELHDSLAQSLVFLRIQMTRLKRIVEQDNASAQAIIAQIDPALSEANSQLRQLLTTFRLSVKPADLKTALGQVIAQLHLQTEVEIVLEGEQARQHLAAQQQVHVLQIVREALLNAIRHAGATRIVVNCQQEDDEMLIEISDNGAGQRQPAERPGHYGLAIMHERAASLRGRLAIGPADSGGTVVTLQFPLRKG